MFEDKSNGGRNRFFMPEDDNSNLDDAMMNNYVPEPEPYKEKKEQKSKSYVGIMVLIVVIGLVILVGVVFGLTEVFTSPYKIYTKTLDRGFSYVKDYLVILDKKRLDYNPEEDIFRSTGSFKITTDIAKVMELGEYNYDYGINWKAKNEEFSGNLEIKKNNGTLLNWKAILKEGNVYTKLDNIYDKPILLSEDEILGQFFKKRIDYNDVLNILEVFKDYVGSNIEKSNISHDKGTFKIKNKTLKVNRNNYVLSKELVEKKYKGLLKALREDNNAMDSLASILGISKKEVDSQLKKWASDKSIINKLQEMKVVIYTKGLVNTVVGVSLYVGEDEILSFGVLDKVKELKINFEEGIFSLVNENNYNDILVKVGNTEIAKGEISLNGDTYNIDVDVSVGGLGLNVKGQLERKKIGGKRQTLKLALDGNFSYDRVQNNFKIELDNTTQIGGEIASEDVSSVVKAENLDESVINSNLRKVFGDSIIYEGIKNFINSFKVQALEVKCKLVKDCACVDDFCICKYMDKNGNEQRVTCSNTN